MNPKWKAKWDKKKLFDENGNVALLVSKGDQTNNETGVDALGLISPSKKVALNQPPR